MITRFVILVLWPISKYAQQWTTEGYKGILVIIVDDSDSAEQFYSVFCMDKWRKLFSHSIGLRVHWPFSKWEFLTKMQSLLIAKPCSEAVQSSLIPEFWLIIYISYCGFKNRIYVAFKSEILHASSLTSFSLAIHDLKLVSLRSESI